LFPSIVIFLIVVEDIPSPTIVAQNSFVLPSSIFIVVFSVPSPSKIRFEERFIESEIMYVPAFR